MSVILISPTGSDVQVNMWNWRPTMLLVRKAIELDDERFELLQVNGVGASISQTEAAMIADYLDTYLADFPKDGRMLLDGAITKTPDTYEFYRNNWEKNYSASYSWLVEFRDFCRNSEGFKVS
jgi:hypothetical protein